MAPLKTNFWNAERAFKDEVILYQGLAPEGQKLHAALLSKLWKLWWVGMMQSHSWSLTHYVPALAATSKCAPNLPKRPFASSSSQIVVSRIDRQDESVYLCTSFSFDQPHSSHCLDATILWSRRCGFSIVCWAVLNVGLSGVPGRRKANDLERDGRYQLSGFFVNL